MSLNPPSHELASFSDVPPAIPLTLLFIHHSVGGQLMADPGPLESTLDDRRSLHRTHPNGGGLRSLLARQGYIVREASYGSAIGQSTDLFDWAPKFRDSMVQILATRHQDETSSDGTNHIVMFKSCYPNNAFKSAPVVATEACGTALTLPNAKATLAAVRVELAKYPKTLFVYLSAPPLCAGPREALWKSTAKVLLRRPTREQEHGESAALAREFNDWLTSPSGWLAGYPERNIVVFDYFDLLTGASPAQNRSNFLQYASNGGTDNHPHSQAQSLAATLFVSFLNRAVRYAGLA